MKMEEYGHWVQYLIREADASSSCRHPVWSHLYLPGNAADTTSIFGRAKTCIVRKYQLFNNRVLNIKVINPSNLTNEYKYYFYEPNVLDCSMAIISTRKGGGAYRDISIYRFKRVLFRRRRLEDGSAVFYIREKECVEQKWLKTKERYMRLFVKNKLFCK